MISPYLGPGFLGSKKSISKLTSNIFGYDFHEGEYNPKNIWFTGQYYG